MSNGAAGIEPASVREIAVTTEAWQPKKTPIYTHSSGGNVVHITILAVNGDLYYRILCGE